MCTASAAYSAGAPRRAGKGTEAPRESRASSRQTQQHRRQEDAGRDRVDAHADLREFARDRKRHRRHPALGGGIGRLPDLPVIGGDRRGRNNDAAFTLERFEPGHRSRGEADHVERADQIDADHPVEIGKRMRPIAADDALGDADAGAVDQHPRRAMRGLGLRDRRARRGLIRDVADNGEAAERPGRLLARRRVEIEHRHAGAFGGKRLGRRPAEPRASARHDRGNSSKLHRSATPSVRLATPLATDGRRRHKNLGGTSRAERSLLASGA